MVNNGSKESKVRKTYFAETRENDVQFAYRATAAAIVRWAERMQADREVQVRVVGPVWPRDHPHERRLLGPHARRNPTHGHRAGAVSARWHLRTRRRTRVMERSTRSIIGQTDRKSTAYTWRKKAIADGALDVTVEKSDDGFYTVSRSILLPEAGPTTSDEQDFGGEWTIPARDYSAGDEPRKKMNEARRNLPDAVPDGADPESSSRPTSQARPDRTAVLLEA